MSSASIAQDSSHLSPAHVSNFQAHNPASKLPN